MPFSDWTPEDIARFKQLLEAAVPPDDEHGPYFDPLVRYAQLPRTTRKMLESLTDGKLERLETLLDLSPAKINILWELPLEKMKRLDGLLEIPPEKLAPVIELPVQKILVAVELSDTVKSMGHVTTVMWKAVGAFLVSVAAALTAYKMIIGSWLGGK